MRISSVLLLLALVNLSGVAPASAQLIPDNTLGNEASRVIRAQPGDAEIDGGARRGSNLFHSFREFNVEEGGNVYFRSPGNIENILTRVTGDNASNLFGTLGVLGDANLFLLNPHGIIFGPDAGLDIQGSFTATTAERFLFSDGGEFSAIAPQPPSLLSISVPTGLQYGVRPGSIVVNQSFLGVPLGETLTLAGGDIQLDGAFLYADLGNIYLTSIAAPGTIDLQPNGRFGIPETLALGTIRLLNDSTISATVPSGVRGNAGEIHITGDTLLLRDGSILETTTFGRGNAGDIRILMRDRTQISGVDDSGFPSTIYVDVAEEAIGNGGTLRIGTGSLNLSNEGRILASTTGEGNGGRVIISAQGQAVIGQGSVIGNSVLDDAVGDAGSIQLRAGTLILQNGGQINSFTRNQGNGGNITLFVRDRITIDGEDRDGFPSSISASVNEGAVGNSGRIRINANSLSLINGSRIFGATSGEGKGGNIIISLRDRLLIDGFDSEGAPSRIVADVDEGAIGNGGTIQIEAGSLSLTNTGQIFASTSGRGNSGQIVLSVRDQLLVDGTYRRGESSLIASSVLRGAIGEGGTIDVQAGSLSLINGGQINAFTIGRGDSGDIFISVRDRLLIDGMNSNENASIIAASVEGGAIGNGGTIDIDVGSLTIANDGRIIGATYGRGNGGNIFISARDAVLIDGENGSDVPSAIFAAVEPGAIGNGGRIQINANSLLLTNGGSILGATSGEGKGGNIIISLRDHLLIDGFDSEGAPSRIVADVNEGAIGEGGTIQIEAGSLSLTNTGQIAASTFGRGNSGQIVLSIRDQLLVDGTYRRENSSLIASSVLGGAIGDGGTIDVQAGSLSLINGGQINAFTVGRGDSGDIFISVRDRLLIDGMNSNGNPSAIVASVEGGAIGNGGTIDIDTDSLTIANDGRIVGATYGRGNGGNIFISARDSILIDGENGSDVPSAIFAAVEPGAIGNGGTIQVTTPELTVNNGGEILANSRGAGSAGNIILDIPQIYVVDGLIDAETSFASEELGANIRLEDLDLLVMEDGSLISARALGEANGGNISIDAPDGFLVGLPFENNDIIATAERGDGGVISLQANRIFGFIDQTDAGFNFEQLRANSTSDISASSEFGTSGLVTLDTLDTDPTQGLATLPGDVVDASNQVGQVCPTGPGASERLGRFVVTGRGGIAPSPLGLQEDLGFSVDWMRDEAAGVSPSGEVMEDNSSQSDQPFVEADGWQVGVDGQVQLVASAASPMNLATPSMCPDAQEP